MAVQADDLTFLKSSLAGSTGGTLSGTDIVSGSLNNLWEDLSPAEATAGGVKIKKWGMRNDSADETLPDFGTWLAGIPAGATEELAVGVNAADDSDPTQGNMTDWGALNVVALTSDGIDTRIATVIGDNALGAPVEEQVTLNGTTEVLSTVQFLQVNAIVLSSVDGARTVTVREATGGVVRGTIGPTLILCWSWQSPADITTAIHRMSLDPGESVMFWDRLTWPPGLSELDPADSVIAVQRM